MLEVVSCVMSATFIHSLRLWIDYCLIVIEAIAKVRLLGLITLPDRVVTVPRYEALRLSLNPLGVCRIVWDTL